MPIRVKCRKCGKAYQVKEQAAGKQFKCKSCGSAVRVPAQAQTDADGDFLNGLTEMEAEAPPYEDPAAAGLPPRAGAQPKRRGRKPQQQRAGSGLAITSLILGIGSLFLCWLWFVSIPAALLAVILGAVARSKAKTGTAGGAGIALAGIICGAIGFVLWLLFVLLFAALFFGSSEALEQMGEEFQQQMEQMEEQIEEQIEEQRVQPPELNVPDDSTEPGEDVFEDPSAIDSNRADSDGEIELDRIVPVIKKQATLEAEPSLAHSDTKSGEDPFSVTRVIGLADVVGTWHLSIDSADGNTYEIPLKITKAGNKFKGIYAPVGVAASDVTNLKVEDGNLMFDVTTDYYGTPIDLSFKGRLDGGKIKGMQKWVLKGDTGEDPFSATRAATAGRRDDKHIQFNGKDAHITADGIPFDSYNTFTIETWLKDWKGPILGQGLIRDDPENGIVMSLEFCGWESRKGGNYLLSAGDKLAASWNHLALVYDGKQQLVFVNGRPTSLAPAPKPGPLNKTRQFLIGALEHRGNRKRYGSGLLRSVRVSKTARYTAQFAPAQRLTADGDTVLLYNFSRGQGSRVSDQADSKRDGTIHGAVWVETAGTGIASSPQRESDKQTDQEMAAGVQTGDDSQTTANVVADAQQNNRQGKQPWGSGQAIGEPESFQPGDNPLAWASQTPDGQKEWLLLEYEESVVPTDVRIYESFNPGAVERVTLFRSDGTEVEVWKVKNPKPSKSPARTLHISVKKGIDFPTKRVKVYLDSPSVPGWNQINAVALWGRIGGREVQLYAVKAEASSSF